MSEDPTDVRLPGYKTIIDDLAHAREEKNIVISIYLLSNVVRTLFAENRQEAVWQEAEKSLTWLDREKGVRPKLIKDIRELIEFYRSLADKKPISPDTEDCNVKGGEGTN